MTILASAFGPLPQFSDAAGAPDLSYKLFTYLAGSNTKATTYTDATGLSSNTNPIVLNALGQPSSGYFWASGTTYKVVLAPSTDSDPPVSPVWTIDNLSGMNDAGAIATQNEWVTFGNVPTYVSATSFTLVGNQTATFQPGRRIKTTNTGGTVYSTILTSIFGAVTAITVFNTSGVLDAGLSAVSYALLSSTNPSTPPVILSGYLFGMQGSTAGASTTLTVSIGKCVDSTGLVLMQLITAMAKTTASWAGGTAAGGLDTGAIAASTFYYWYGIHNPTTGADDITYSLSPTLPAFPAGYTTYRRLFAWATNAASQWESVVQVGDYFERVSVPTGFTGVFDTTAGNQAVTGIPSGIQTRVRANVVVTNAAAGVGIRLYNPNATDLVVDAAPPGSTMRTQVAGLGVSGQVEVLTNTSGQVRVRCSAATTTISFYVIGWFDDRGRVS